MAQTTDTAAAWALLETAGESAGLLAGGFDAPGVCWIAAAVDGAMVGVVGVEAIVDAAAIRSLAVAPAMGRRGIGAALVAAARRAAHTRGARRLYALAPCGQRYLRRFGFAPVAWTEMIDDLAGTFTAGYLSDYPQVRLRIEPLVLDISRDGLIER